MLVDSHPSVPAVALEATSRSSAVALEATSRSIATILPFPQDRMRAPQQPAQSPRPAPSAGPTTDIGLAMGKLREAVAACQKALSAQHAAASALAASVADMRHIAEDMIATNRQVQKDVSGICTKARAFQLPPVTAD